MSFDAVGNALQFLLILGVDVRPEHLLRRRAEELPVTLALMSVEQLDRLEGVGDFGRASR